MRSRMRRGSRTGAVVLAALAVVGGPVAQGRLPRAYGPAPSGLCHGLVLHTPTQPVEFGAAPVLRASLHCRTGVRARFAFFAQAGMTGRFNLLRGWGRGAIRWSTQVAWPGRWGLAVWARAGPTTWRAAGQAVVSDGWRSPPRGARALLPPHNPAANGELGPDFRAVCAAAGRDSRRCWSAQIDAVDRARSAEGLGPLQIPSTVRRVTPAELLLAWTDEERISRGLPPVLGLVPALDGAAVGAARLGRDATVPFTANGDRVLAGGSNWATDIAPLATGYDWLYEDGPGSVNQYCPAPGPAPGCWAHRDSILARLPTGPATWRVMGAAAVPWPPTGGISDEEILASVRGTRPPLLFTWAEAVRLGF